MSQPMLEHRFTIGRYLWLVIAVALGLALSMQVAGAKECHRETPLAAAVRLIAPGPEVPEAVARFVGAWVGVLRPSGIPGAMYQLGRLLIGRGRFALCHTLVVEEVFANGYARVIFSFGIELSADIYWPTFLRVTGRIVDGTLRFHLPAPDRPELAYRVADETLQGTYTGNGRRAGVKLTRVADISHLGCAQQAGRVPAAPPKAGPRDQLTAPELLAPTYTGAGPVHNAFFMPVGQPAPALHAFKGTLRVGASTMFRAQRACGGLPETLGGFSVAFFTHGDHLVPVVRDILRPPGIILSPGRV